MLSSRKSPWIITVKTNLKNEYHDYANISTKINSHHLQMNSEKSMKESPDNKKDNETDTNVFWRKTAVKEDPEKSNDDTYKLLNTRVQRHDFHQYYQ